MGSFSRFYGEGDEHTGSKNQLLCRDSETVHTEDVLVGSAILSFTVSMNSARSLGLRLALKGTIASSILLSPPAFFYPTFPALRHDAIPGSRAADPSTSPNYETREVMQPAGL